MNTLRSVAAVMVLFSWPAGLRAAEAATAPASKLTTLTDKTLVAWVHLANTTQEGGSVLTVQDQAERFDAIVLGELQAGKWMAGSDGFSRSQKDQNAWPAETADPKTLVQIAAVYAGNEITLYRDGRLYSRHRVRQRVEFGRDCIVLMGLRHLGVSGGTKAYFAGSIEEARIYAVPLSAEQIAALAPNKPSDATLRSSDATLRSTSPPPVGCWAFEDGSAADSMKNFPPGRLEGHARIAGGRLQLDGVDSYFIAAPPPAQPPHYYPRGMSMWDTWYLQRGSETHCFHLQIRRPGPRPAADEGSIGHAVSEDLIHWKELPVVLRKGPPGSYDDSWALFTGCAVEHGGLIHLFYCGNHDQGGRVNQTMCLATSADGVTFQRHPSNPLFEPDPKRYYSIHDPPPPFKHHAHPHIDCRDLAVVKDPDGEGYLGYVVMRRKGQADAFHSACVALCRSKDLIHWEVGEPCCTPDRFNCFEVPDVFCLNGRWYMIALTGDGYGQSKRWADPGITAATVVFQADKPQGPFVEVRDNLLLASTGQQGYSARTVERNGERLMLYTRSEGRFGRLAWPLKLAPRPGGGLLPLYWAGVDKAFGPAQKPAGDGAAELKPDKSPAFRPLEGLGDLGRTYMITATVELKDARSAGGIFFGRDGAWLAGAGAVLDAAGGSEGQVALIGGADGRLLQGRRLPLGPDRPYKLRLVAVHGMIDVYVDDVLAINYFMRDLGGGEVGLYARDGSVSFRDIQYRSQADSP